MNGVLGDVLFPEDVLRGRVLELGEQISADYFHADLVVLGVLKGAAAFTVDLARAIRIPLVMDWVAVSTYRNGASRGERRVLKDVQEELRGRDVLVVEDVLDTGGTLSWLSAEVASRGAASVASCVLLRKPNSLGRAIRPDYVGFDIEVDWVAGYGIDHSERWRNRSEIREVVLRSGADPDRKGRLLDPS